jgi:hypothetical protein
MAAAHGLRFGISTCFSARDMLFQAEPKDSFHKAQLSVNARRAVRKVVIIVV